MARIRTIKPDFWTDAALGECSTSARLLFIGTWNFADDEGRLNRSARQLKAQIFPYDSLEVEPLIQELISNCLLVEYQVDGKSYLQIKNFHKHQKIDRRTPSRIPAPQFDEGSMTPRREFVEDSSSPRSGREGKGRESNGRDLIPVEPEARPDQTSEVFNHWKSVHSHPAAKLDPKRERLIAAALKRYSVAQLCQAISGYLNSPHHMGQNDRGTVYDSIELMLRDAGHIDAGLKFHAQPPAQAETEYDRMLRGTARVA